MSFILLPAGLFRNSLPRALGLSLYVYPKGDATQSPLNCGALMARAKSRPFPPSHELLEVANVALRSDCSSECHQIAVLPIVARLRRRPGERP
jgi:hypothetical protein